MALLLQLSASIAGYTLTNVLSSETLAFDNQGRYLSDTDAYGNQDSLSDGTGTSGPISETNSGGSGAELTARRALAPAARS